MKAGGTSEIARSDRRARLCEFPGLKSLAGFREPEPAAPSGRNRQAERWKSQGATLVSRLCEFPGLAPLSGVWGGSPMLSERNVVSEQTAKRSTIETGLIRGAGCPLQQKSISGDGQAASSREDGFLTVLCCIHPHPVPRLTARRKMGRRQTSGGPGKNALAD